MLWGRMNDIISQVEAASNWSPACYSLSDSRAARMSRSCKWPAPIHTLGCRCESDARHWKRKEVRARAYYKKQQRRPRDRSGLRNVLGVIIMMIVVIAIYFPPPFNYLSSIIRAAAACNISLLPRRAHCLYTHEYLCKLIFITMNNLGEQSKLDFTSAQHGSKHPTSSCSCWPSCFSFCASATIFLIVLQPFSNSILHAVGIKMACFRNINFHLN